MRAFPFLVVFLVASTLTAAAALAEPAHKKPLYPPPEQSSSVGVLGAHHPEPGARNSNAQPPPPVAAPAEPKVEAEPPQPLAAPERFDVHADDEGVAGAAGAPLTAAPMGPPPSGFLPDHPFVSGIVAGLIGADLGSKLYGGPMTGDQDGVMIGYVARIALILFLAWLAFRAVARRASGASGESRLPPQRRREPSFGRAADAGGGRREPTIARRDR